MSTTTTDVPKTLPMASSKSPAKKSGRKVGKTASKPAAKAAPKVELTKPPVAKLRKSGKPEGFELGFQIARNEDGSAKLPRGNGGVRFESTAGDDGKPEMVVYIPQRRWAKMGKPEVIGAAFAQPSE